MGKPVWPFGSLESIDFGMKPGDDRRANQMEAGNIKWSTSTSAPLGEIAGTIWLSRGQFATFERWYDVTLKGGRVPFLMPDQINDDMPLLDDDYVALLDDAGVEYLLRSDWWLLIFAQPDPYTVERIEGADWIGVTVAFKRIPR